MAFALIINVADNGDWTMQPTTDRGTPVTIDEVSHLLRVVVAKWWELHPEFRPPPEPPRASAYALWLKQDGEGCDYTIGCGNTLLDITADTAEDARAKALAEFGDGGDYAYHLRPDAEDPIARAVLYALVEEFDIGAMRREVAEVEKRAACEAEEARERAQLERLRAKYEKG